MMEDVPSKESPGPVVTAGGVRFSLYSDNATRVELCLFEDPASSRETRCLPLERSAEPLWTRFVPGVGPGLRYGYRVFGPYQPEEGHRFNPAKLVVDPYARLLGRPLTWDERLYSEPETVGAVPDPRDSAPVAPLCEIAEDAFDWQDDRPPDTPWNRTLIYETHVKSISQQHPGVPESLRGTFAGLASPAVVEHLTDLGITAVELLPVQQAVDEHPLVRRGLGNYWGYNTLLHFAPDRRLARTGGDPVREFKEMVRALHRVGIEVILDVVFNHSPEGNATGPTLSFRGIDNRTYYHLDADAPANYLNWTGCGNSFNAHHPAGRRLLLDALRYWVREMHVDGFRFDLAVTLFRDPEAFAPEGALFRAFREDPVLSRVKLIAEPWDLGDHGYRLSGFPPEWSEWNDQYRQTVRRFWKGDRSTLGVFARRFSGSSDLFTPALRRPRASINYVTCHDGFTLQDLVSYNRKHNEANGEHNRDGTDANDSHNYGAEGVTDDPAIIEIRERQKRNLLATLLLSLGTPMLLGGDEIGRTQQGNNNAYCQDNALSWYDWNLGPAQQDFLEFTRYAIHLRRSNPTLHRAQFLRGAESKNPPGKDVTWLSAAGKELTRQDWEKETLKSKAILLDANHLQESGPDGQRVQGRSVLILLNASRRTVSFRLPPPPSPAAAWRCVLDTRWPRGRDKDSGPCGDIPVELSELTMKVLETE